MTPTALILIVAGCLLLLAVVPLLTYAWWPRPRRREPRTLEPPRTAQAAVKRWTLPLRLVSWTREHIPDHAGATAGWSPLATIGAQDICPELAPVLTIEQIQAEVHADFAPIGALIDAFDLRWAQMMAEFTGPLPAETCIRLEAASWPTGEWDVAELRALLAAEDRELVAA